MVTRFARHLVERFLLPLSFFAACTRHSVPSQDDHDSHKEEPVAVTAFGDDVLLHMEFPHLMRGNSVEFLVYVTVLSTGEPLRRGELRLEFSGGDGASQHFDAKAPRRAGLYILEGALTVAGEYQGRLVIESQDLGTEIDLPTFVVHESEKSADEAAHLASCAADHDHIEFLFDQQWKVGLLTEEVTRRNLTQRLQVPAEIEAPPSSMVVVGAPVAGRLHRAGEASLPRIGDLVEAGQVLAYLEPALTAADQAQLLANEINRRSLEMDLLIREFDVRARSLELEQSLFQSQAKLEFAEKVLARIEGLREKGIGAERELDAARRDVELAHREVKSDRVLFEAFEASKMTIANLQSRSEQKGALVGKQGLLRQPIIAPIAGEIVESFHVEGEYVENFGSVYRILDPNVIWIDAHVSEFDLDQVKEDPGALLEFGAYPGRRFDVIKDLGGTLVHTGWIVDPETRSLPIHYEAPNLEGLFRVGMFADIFLESRTVSEVVAVPEEAIVMDNGQAVVFVQESGEAFEKRWVELGVRDGRYVEVRLGVDSGDRVVTRGAYLVKLAGTSPASFGEGHTH